MRDGDAVNGPADTTANMRHAEQLSAVLRFLHNPASCCNLKLLQPYFSAATVDVMGGIEQYCPCMGLGRLPASMFGTSMTRLSAMKILGLVFLPTTTVQLLFLVLWRGALVAGMCVVSSGLESVPVMLHPGTNCTLIIVTACHKFTCYCWQVSLVQTQEALEGLQHLILDISPRRSQCFAERRGTGKSSSTCRRLDTLVNASIKDQ